MTPQDLDEDERAAAPAVNPLLAKLRGLNIGKAPPSMSLEAWSAGAAVPGAPTKRLATGRDPVEDSEDFQRIVALPRRAQVNLSPNEFGEYSATAQALMRIGYDKHSRGPRACNCRNLPGGHCITELRPAQAWALHEGPLAGGVFGIVGVGDGKTGLDILMAMAMPGCKQAVLFIPSGLLTQLRNDYALWAEHWHVPSLMMPNPNDSVIIPGRPVLHVIPYTKLSRAEATALLTELKPDLIIADEGHNFRYANAARTARFLRYYAAHAHCRLCIWSGTLLGKKVQDIAHLATISLREASPLPLSPPVVAEWGGALNPSDWPGPPGILRKLCAPGEDLYAGFHRRIVETRGVIATVSGAVGASINIFERKPPEIPDVVADMLTELRTTGTRPDGEELIDDMAVHATARQLACGFYYRWVFPRGEARALIEEWFEARKEWHRELRLKLKRQEEHLDSALLCSKAAIRAYGAEAYKGDLPVWYSDCWERWVAVRDSVYHEKDAVWVSDYLARDAAEWALKNTGVVWYGHDTFGRKVGALSGLDVFGADTEQALLADKGKRSVICSIKSHGTGRDGLQRKYSDQLVANSPSSGDIWEQLLGRLHRPGHCGDEVNTHVYRHTYEMREAIDKAVIQAKFIEGITGTHQKLLRATCAFLLDNS